MTHNNITARTITRCSVILVYGHIHFSVPDVGSEKSNVYEVCCIACQMVYKHIWLIQGVNSTAKSNILLCNIYLYLLTYLPTY